VNGLRMYVPALGATQSDDGKVFYSRRGNGPYYCWFYEEANQKWSVSRVISHDFEVQPLSLATWKTVPSALQSRLSDHYMD
jgi:hypothetical protein